MIDSGKMYPITDIPPDLIARNLRAVEASLSVLCGKWKIMIVAHLDDGPHRFTELRKFMPLISQQSLVVQLRELEKDGVVSRQVYLEVPPRVEYSLTALGRKISPIMMPLMIWGYEVLKTRADRAEVGELFGAGVISQRSGRTLG